MAVFGVQFVITIIVASFLQKLSPYYSLGRWLVTKGLTRYLPPSDSALRPHVGGGGGGGGGGGTRGRKKGGPSADPAPLDGNLTLLKSASLELPALPVTTGDVLLLRYSSELPFIIDLSLATLTVVLSTLLYFHFYPSAAVSEYNLSCVWLMATCGYCVKTLGSLSQVYFSEVLSRERSTAIVFTSLFFVCALAVLLLDERVLDFGLDESYHKLQESIAKTLESVMDPKEFSLLPKWVYKICLAVLASFLSALQIYPGFRFAGMHFDTVYSCRRTLLKTLLQLCYISPMFSLAMWIKPLSTDVLPDSNKVALLGVELTLDTFRSSVLVVICLLRILLYRVYLQSYLNLARVHTEDMKVEPGRITVSMLRKKISSVFAFYCGVGVQYVAPAMLLLSLAVMLGFSGNSVIPDTVDEDGNTFRFSGFGISLFHGCISFLCWWLCFTHFVASGLGAVLRAVLNL